MAVEVKCKKHPWYKGVKWPKVHCKWCEFIWLLRNGQHVKKGGGPEDPPEERS